MAIRKIIWTVSDDGLSISPTSPQAGGVQGENNATEVIFRVGEGSVWADAKYKVYVECEDAVGHHDTTQPLQVEGGQISVLLPLAWTQYGSMITLRLVAEEKDGVIAYTVEGKATFTNRNNSAKKVDGLLRGRLAEVEARLNDAVETAETAAGEAQKAADSAVYAAGSASTSREGAYFFAQQAKESVKTVEEMIAAVGGGYNGGKILIVTASSEHSYGLADHSSQEVYEHIQNGGSVMLRVGDMYIPMDVATPITESNKDNPIIVFMVEDFLNDGETVTWCRIELHGTDLNYKPLQNVSGTGGTLVVTCNRDEPTASHTASQIYEHIQNGGTAVLLRNKAAYLTLVDCDPVCASFLAFEAEDSVFSGVMIFDDGSIEEYERAMAPFDYVREIDITSTKQWSERVQDTARANIAAASAKHLDELTEQFTSAINKVGMGVGEAKATANDAMDEASNAMSAASNAFGMASQVADELGNLSAEVAQYAFNQRIVNARDFGAVGDGETDDTKYIQAALYEAEASGLPLYIPAGNYLVSKTITTHTRDEDEDKQSKALNIYGAGMNTVFTTATSFDGDYVFHIDVKNTQPRMLWVHDFAIDLVADVSGIYFEEIGMKGVVENLWITHLYDKDPNDTNVRAGIYCRMSTCTTFQRIKVYGNRKRIGQGHENIGIVCERSYSTKFIDCDIIYCKWAIYLSGGSNDLIEYCRIDENEYGVYQNTTAPSINYMPETRAYPADGEKFFGTARNLTIRNNRFEANNQQAIFLAAYSYGDMNYMYNAQVTIANNDFSTLGKGIAFQTSAREVFRKAIWLYQCKGVVVENNSFSGMPYDETVADTLLQNLVGERIEDITLRGNVAITLPIWHDDGSHTIEKANSVLSVEFVNATDFIPDIEADQCSRYSLGDLSLALDSIIAIQEGLIGGNGE